MNESHYLTNLTRQSFPGQMLFVATETSEEPSEDGQQYLITKLVGWHATYWRLRDGKVSVRTVKTGKTAEEFWHWVISRLEPRQSTWLWTLFAPATLSLLRFDEILQSGQLATRIEYPGVAVQDVGIPATVWEGLSAMGPSTTIIECRVPGDDCPLTILDARNFFRMDWWEMSERFHDCPISYKGSLALTTDDTPPCVYDCHMLERAIASLVALVRSGKLGRMSMTAGAQAMSALRFGRLQYKLLVHRSPEALRLERRAYKGGACRVFRAGEYHDRVYVVDFASFYLGIMAAFDMPYQLLEHCRRDPIEILARFDTGLYVIADVRLESDRKDTLVHVRGKPVWALGKLRTALHHIEIQQLMEDKIPFAIDRYAVYKSGPFLHTFASDLWEIKREARRAKLGNIESVVKVIGNALPGKFGSRRVQCEECPGVVPPEPTCTWTEYDLRTGQSWEYRSLAWRVQRVRLSKSDRDNTLSRPVDQFGNDLTDLSETGSSCPSVAGAITAYGRWVLQQFIDYAGAGNVLYCDTDSLHLTERGRIALSDFVALNPDLPGKLIDESTHSEAEYLGPRHYRLDQQWVIAGIKADATPIGGGRYLQRTSPGWSTVLHRGMPERVTDEFIEIDSLSQQAGGVIGADGSVNPPVLDMWGQS